MYQFLRQLGDERSQTTRDSWLDEFDKFYFPVRERGVTIQRTFCTWNGIALPNIMWRLRAFDALEKWWAEFGLSDCPVATYTPTWDEHVYRQAYEEMQFHAPFDTATLLAKIDAKVGSDLLMFKSTILPEWTLSPSYNYVDEPTKLYRAMRDIWYGPRPPNVRLEFSDCAIQYAWHQNHYFLYQPEPEMWMWIAHHAKPSYSKCRLYALNVRNDMSVFEDRLMNSLVNFQVTKPNGKKELWKAGKPS